jgi:hypothetical protein
LVPPQNNTKKIQSWQGMVTTMPTHSGFECKTGTGVSDRASLKSLMSPVQQIQASPCAAKDAWTEVRVTMITTDGMREEIHHPLKRIWM